MPNRTAYVDYQQRATEFSVGDSVFPYWGSPDQSGRVVDVFPAIGMADVEFPHGNKRYPVEELQRHDHTLTQEPDPENNNVPGGRGTVSVPGGPKTASLTAAERVAHAYVKKSLYWAAKDRHYRAPQAEIDSGNFNCPKCKDVPLRPANYKRTDGVSERLMGCPTCLFLIKRCDIIGHPEYLDDAAEVARAGEPFARIRVNADEGEAA